MEEIIFSARKVNGLKSHNPFKKRLQLENVDFELKSGYIMGIIGKNGAGKTTFFDYIMSEEKKYSGEMFLNGMDIHKNHILTMDNIGFISEANRFIEQRSIMQNVEMFGRFYTRFDMDLFKQTLDISKLSIGKTVGKMSRGEFMKFQFAFAVAHKPKLFLMDEATAGMDPVFRVDFYKLLHNILKDESCSIIMSTHIEEEIDKQIDYIGFFEKGNFKYFKENELT